MPRSLQELQEFSKLLIERATKSEIKLYKALVDKGYTFKFQHIIQPFICDFIFENKYIVELDSPRFHNAAKDTSRDRFLKDNGYFVLRVMSYRVFKDLPNVLNEIERFIKGEAVVKVRKPRKKKAK